MRRLYFLSIWSLKCLLFILRNSLMHFVQWIRKKLMHCLWVTQLTSQTLSSDAENLKKNYLVHCWNKVSSGEGQYSWDNASNWMDLRLSLWKWTFLVLYQIIYRNEDNDHLERTLEPSPNTFLDEVFCFMSSCVTNLTTNKRKTMKLFDAFVFLVLCTNNWKYCWKMKAKNRINKARNKRHIK